MEFPQEIRVLYYPDPRLRRPARPVERITPELRAFIPALFEAMHRARGIGLAGPQVGFAHRVVVASIAQEPEGEPKEEVYLNPNIRTEVGTVREEEGCLSLPGLYAAVSRSREVTVEYTSLEGEVRDLTVSGLHAKLFQHEIDHLDGILMIDRMSPAELRHWAPLLRELEEDFAADRIPEARPRSEAAL